MRTVSDLDEAQGVDLVGRDVESTVGPACLDLVKAVARHQRQFAVDHQTYIARVVEEVQQHVHDSFIDTTWPACPFHPNHPMWFQDGWWVADGRPVVALGGLGGTTA